MVTKVMARVRPRLRRLLYPASDEAIRLVRKELRRIEQRIEQLEQAQGSTVELARRASRTSAQITFVETLNRRQQPDIERLPELLDERRIAEHVRRSVAAAPLLNDPYEHIVVEQVLPDDVYDLLIRAIPPVEFFNQRDPIQQNLRFPMEFGPALSATVWDYLDDVIARRVIHSAVVEKFREPLQRHLASLFGPTLMDRASALPPSAFGGRLMLSRPGYYKGPHRDPKHAMLTCLMYFAREGDNEAFGTQIFRVLDDGEADYKQTYYPEQDGRTCELVKVVPFRPNTMLVFLNSRGAHGARIPPDAPAGLERYAYQFYVAPLKEALAALLKSIPPDQRTTWRSKAQVRA